MTEDEKAGWHHRLDAHEFGWTPGVDDGQGGLACCDSWGRKESDTTEWLNWTELKRPITLMNINSKFFSKILANRTQQYIKKLIQHDHVGFILGVQGFFNVWKSMWYTILTNWNKNHMIISIILKKGNAKQCSNYPTIAFISHASKLMLKILQARLQQYVNCEFPDVQNGFRKGRKTRD